MELVKEEPPCPVCKPTYHGKYEEYNITIAAVADDWYFGVENGMTYLSAWDNIYFETVKEALDAAIKCVDEEML